MADGRPKNNTKTNQQPLEEDSDSNGNEQETEGREEQSKWFHWSLIWSSHGSILGE